MSLIDYEKWWPDEDVEFPNLCELSVHLDQKLAYR